MPKIASAATQAYALGEVGIHYQRVGDLSRTLLLLTEAAQAARRAGDRRWESRIDVTIGLTYIQLGSYSQARSTLEAGLELAQSIGERGLPIMHMNNLSYVYWCLGERDQAIELAERALHEYRATDFSLYGQAGTLNDLGLHLESAGEWSAAAAYLAEARGLYAQLGTNSNCVEPQVVEARCKLTLGRHDEAQSLASEAWKYLLEYGSTGIFFPALVYVGIIDVASAIEIQGVTAREVLEAGYRDLMQRAEKISDPEWRRSFLENVAEDREIVERWQNE